MGDEIDESSTLAVDPAKTSPCNLSTARRSADRLWVPTGPVNRDPSCSPSQYVHPRTAVLPTQQIETGNSFARFST